MGLDEFTGSGSSRNLERTVREVIQEQGFKVQKSVAEGLSGNSWELDAVAYDEEGVPVAYFEVKDIGEDVAKQTYRNHMIRAFAELADFREENAQGAVVIPQKRYFGNKDWDAMFESIGCELIELSELDEFLRRLPEGASS